MATQSRACAGSAAERWPCRLGDPSLTQRHPLDVGHAGGAQHVDESLGKPGSGVGAALILLGHQVNRAQLQRPDGCGGTGTDVRADHHDGPGRFGHDVTDGAETVELGHLQIHQHDIGRMGPNFSERVHAVARRGDHSKLAGSLHHVGEEAAEERTVVHNEHPAGIRDAGPHATPC